MFSYLFLFVLKYLIWIDLQWRYHLPQILSIGYNVNCAIRFISLIMSLFYVCVYVCVSVSIISLFMSLFYSVCMYVFVFIV
jgi:hypothetical protein